MGAAKKVNPDPEQDKALAKEARRLAQSRNLDWKSLPKEERLKLKKEVRGSTKKP
jgi:hypothetical protein